MKRLIGFLVLLGILCSCLSVFALSAGEIRVVVGEDLTDSEITRVYADFHLERGTVPELTVSNEEEHALLGNSLDASVIGSVACSCVCIRVLNEGSGTAVERHNISWCTDEMYKSALCTAGIDDVSVIISAPFEVSGTAALVGIYKAYEDMTGTALSPDAKSAGAKELLLTGELAEEIGSFDATLIVETMKGALDYTESLSDEQLRKQIDAVAESYHVKLNDSQIEQLLTLCRQLEKLDELKLREKLDDIRRKVEQLKNMKEKAAELQEKAGDWRVKLEKAVKDIKTLYRNASTWLDENSDKIQKVWKDIQSLFSKEEEHTV